MTGDQGTRTVRGSSRDQPAPAGAQPRSTRPLTAPTSQDLTEASTGTPSQPEEPRPDLANGLQAAADMVAIMTDELDRKEAPFKPRNTKPITPFTQQS